MPSKRVQEAIDRLVEVLQEEAAESIQGRLRDALGGNVVIPAVSQVKRRKTTKGYTVLRPCPIPGCKDPETGEPRVASPRHQMVCEVHSKELPREEILLARDNAVKEGGVWFNLKPSKKKTA